MGIILRASSAIARSLSCALLPPVSKQMTDPCAAKAGENPGSGSGLTAPNSGCREVSDAAPAASPEGFADAASDGRSLPCASVAFPSRTVGATERASAGAAPLGGLIGGASFGEATIVSGSPAFFRAASRCASRNDPMAVSTAIRATAAAALHPKRGCRCRLTAAVLTSGRGLVRSFRVA